MKMEGIGNDFIITHHIAPELIPLLIPHVPKLCNRKRGIGADGVICILSSRQADFKMRIFNSDGSEAEMCGNGIRCCAKYIKMLNLSTLPRIAIETLAGLIQTEMVTPDEVKVSMGHPRLSPREIPVATDGEQVLQYPLQFDTLTLAFTAVSMGNPHAVIFTESLADELVLQFGPKIENHALFPEKTNVEFVKVLFKSEIAMRVWERGCGETEACGTGACAAVVAGILNGKHDKKVTVHLPGGDLTVSWSGIPHDPVFMTGAATAVFSGQIELTL